MVSQGAGRLACSLLHVQTDKRLAGVLRIGVKFSLGKDDSLLISARRREFHARIRIRKLAHMTLDEGKPSCVGTVLYIATNCLYRTNLSIPSLPAFGESETVDP